MSKTADGLGFSVDYYIIPCFYYAATTANTGTPWKETARTETPLDGEPSGQIPPWTETPAQRPSLPDRDPWKEHWTRDRDPLERTGPGSQTGSDIIQRLPCGQTDTCKSITLPQIPFVGSNNTSVEIVEK